MHKDGIQKPTNETLFLTFRKELIKTKGEQCIHYLKKEKDRDNEKINYYFMYFYRTGSLHDD